MADFTSGKRLERHFEEARPKPLKEMTNGEFFEAFCVWDFKDIGTISRMVQAMLQKRGVADKPLWERERVYDAWIREPFDEAGWSRAKRQTSIES